MEINIFKKNEKSNTSKKKLDFFRNINKINFSFDFKKEFNKSLLPKKRIKSTEDVSLNYIDEIYFSHYKKYIKSLESNKGLSDSAITDIINDAKKENHKDFKIFIGRDYEHELYIKEIREIINYDYIDNIKDFKELFTTKFLEEMLFVESNKKNKNIELSKEQKKNISKYTKLLKIAKANFILPFEYDGKKYLGILHPTSEIYNFEFDDVFFLSPSIFDDFFTIKSLAFFDDKSMTDTTGEELVNVMLTNILNAGYEDLTLQRYSHRFYELKGYKEGDYVMITQKLPVETAKSMILDLLKRMKEDPKTRKGVIRRNIYIDILGVKRYFRVNFVNQSKVETNIYDNDRIISIRSLAGNNYIKKFDEIGYPLQIRNILKDTILNGKSRIMWLGETASGKTTQEYTCLYLAYLLLEGKIVTVSSPKEIEIDGFAQVDMTDFPDNSPLKSFSNLLPNLLQQKPTIIAFDELKEIEDFRTFIVQLISRGESAWTSFHAQSCEDGINLLANNSKVDIKSFSGSLDILIHTDRVKKLCQKCFGKKCDECKNKGTSGSIPVIEFVKFTSKFNSSIDDPTDLSTLSKEGKVIHITKKQSAEGLYKAKLISKDIYEKHTGRTSLEIENKIRDIKTEGLNYA